MSDDVPAVAERIQHARGVAREVGRTRLLRRTVPDAFDEPHVQE